MGKGDRKTRRGKRFIHSPRKGARFGREKYEGKRMENNVEKKMNALEEYLEKLDSSGYGHNSSKINEEFQEIIRKLVDAGVNDIALKADLDRQVFAVRKSFNYVDDEDKGTAKGLSWQTSGVQTLQDGSEKPLYWPDVRNFTQQDFEYFEERYNNTKNLYAKTEYGLMVYFGQKTDFSKRNDFKSFLCDELISLAEIYYNEAKHGEYIKIRYILSTLIIAYKIASNSKLSKQLEDSINFIFEVQQNWDIEKSNTPHIPLRYSVFMSENYGVFNKFIDFSKVITRNDYAILLIENDNLYNAVDALIINDKIKQKVGQSIEASIRKRAELYERIADQRKNDMASLHFIELAQVLYKQLKDEEKTKELEILYSEKRGTFPLTGVSTKLPQAYINAINDAIKHTIETNDGNGLLDLFTTTPWYETDDSIRSLSEAVERGFIDSLPLSIIDERGNTIKTYTPEEGKFWSTYSYYFDFGTMKMVELFKAAISSEKLTYESTLSYLEKTWLNEPIVRNYNGGEKEIVPLDTIKPGIKRIFEEFRNAKIIENYICDFVTIIDSLTLKIEGILRFFIEKLGIPTFSVRRTKEGNVIMEKLFDDIIADLQSTPERPVGFAEDHRTLIKYVMSEKIGWNLRNEVAHALLQIEDYTPNKIVVLFSFVLKLSKYQFLDSAMGSEPQEY